MVLDSLSSLRKSQNPFAALSPSFRRSLHGGDELGSWSTIYRRHRFLIKTMVLLAVLCTIYLYFAVTFEASESESCSGLTGTEEALCRVRQAKDSMTGTGKLKFC